MRFEPGDRVLLIDSKDRRYLVTLRQGGSFHFHRGIVEHDQVIGAEDGLVVRTAGGEQVVALRPTYEDFVLKMPRGAQVVYPKDAATILIYGDIYPGASVLEAGVGSGALSIALLRAVGPEGRVTSYEIREDFADQALENIQSFMGKPENFEICRASVYDPFDEKGPFDRVVLDLAEPWRAIPQVLEVLRPGGIFVSYLPTVLQIHQLVEELKATDAFRQIVTVECLNRTWHVEDRSVRPDHRMVGHTGFITRARLVDRTPRSSSD